MRRMATHYHSRSDILPWNLFLLFKLTFVISLGWVCFRTSIVAANASYSSRNAHEQAFLEVVSQAASQLSDFSLQGIDVSNFADMSESTISGVPCTASPPPYSCCSGARCPHAGGVCCGDGQSCCPKGAACVRSPSGRVRCAMPSKAFVEVTRNGQPYGCRCRAAKSEIPCPCIPEVPVPELPTSTGFVRYTPPYDPHRPPVAKFPAGALLAQNEPDPCCKLGRFLLLFWHSAFGNWCDVTFLGPDAVVPDNLKPVETLSKGMLEPWPRKPEPPPSNPTPTPLLVLPKRDVLPEGIRMRLSLI